MRLLILLFILNFQAVGAFEVDKIDIENHPQDSYPKISVSIGGKTLDYYGSDSAGEAIRFMKEEEMKLEGEIPLSGYIFAKEFVESFRIPKTLANKKNKNEFIRIFSEKDAGKLIEFLIAVDEKKRTAENDDEIKILERKITESKTDDNPASTPYFSTGYIELKSPKGNNERYFIKLSDVNKGAMTLTPDKTKISMLKSITIYSFQNILSGLNFGDIEKGSQEEKLYEELERTNLSLCGLNCPTSALKDLSAMALNIGKIVSFEVVGNTKIENMDDFNKYVLAQQWCILREFTKSCQDQSLEDEIKNMQMNKIVKDLIMRHKSEEDLCKFLQK